ncbi:MAG TPA: cation diffusion facilitator family transporter [Candidatus Acidoferrales bacterium]|nr:cation diffusion facilitator family transporter [Candidatus Acidoferrales bacterium]
MSTAAAQLGFEQEQREKKSVALSSLLAALLLVTMKTVVGLTTGSLGVLSEAAHSGLDMIAAAITYFSVRVASKPADADHQYGHGKIENFSAFLETGLLLITCAWILWEAVRRLFFKEVHVEPSLWAFGVMGISIVIDHFRSRALDRVARKYNSQALEADALHFRTDVWSSSVVILGLVGVVVAERWQWSALRHADPIAALVVAGIVVWISVRLGKRTVDVLLDAAPAGLRTQVETAAATVEGVLSVDRVRTRRAGNRTFVDITIAVPRTNSFERVHSISDRVEDAVRKALGEVDVMVHMEPRAPVGENLFDQVRAIAQQHDLLIHELSAHQVLEGPGDQGRLVLELDAEVDESLTLRQAHALADRVEKEIYRALSQVSQIHTHIETLGQAVVPAAELSELAQALEAHLADAPYHFPDLIDCHDVQVRQVEGKVVASCHATLDGSLPITRVHDITQQLEARTLRYFPQLFRLTIHTEPPEER